MIEAEHVQSPTYAMFNYKRGERYVPVSNCQTKPRALDRCVRDCVIACVMRGDGMHRTR
jgi:hypothetical protein